jgi:quinoprotein glucose dehydrogenase
MCRPTWLALSAGLFTACLLAAEQPQPTYQAKVMPASPEAEMRLRKFRVPAGLKAELWAAEPMVANIVSFSFDERGRCFVAETFRHNDNVPDIRGHMNWLDDDLASRTVEDRFAMYKKFLGSRLDTYTTHHDRVRMLEDTTGSGKADKSTVFAEGFNTHVAGIGAGVLARQGKVYYTCIPDLWLLEDTKGTGVADVRKSLSYGYGVHNGFIGHDLHGLRFGPDGKLYFSIGDRGLNVVTADSRTVSNPDSGAVIRCNPDGTELELFAMGLRNPQELAFDEFGNLFTGDNNSDSGDKARWVHVVEGGDSGWRTGYQYMGGDYSRGPFNAEKLWYPQHDGQAAYIVPPLMNIADGPSGLTHDPGTGLPDQFRGMFFLCDFRGGNSGTSGVRSIKMKPKGASFEVAEQKEFFWSVLATDCDFGPDGAFYVSDWHEGWNKPGKGRLYRLVNPEFQGSALQKEVQRLLAEGMDKRPVEELTKLLSHVDQRVRQEAQFALAGKGQAAVAPLAAVTKDDKNRLARVHAIWGLGQIGRSAASAVASAVQPLLTDADSEVRAQAAKVSGDVRLAGAAGALVSMLKDTEPRVRFFAAQSLGKLGAKDAVQPLLAMLRDNTANDPFLRHAGVMGLAGTKDVNALAGLSNDPSPAVRTGALLALRRLGSPEVARFLTDTDANIVLEAARAIYDTPIAGAMEPLADLLGVRPNLPDPLGRRVLAANLRVGTPENADTLARYAARPDAPVALRTMALTYLGQWAAQVGRDPVVGLWRPIEAKSGSTATAALRLVLADLFTGPDAIREKAATLAGQLSITDAVPQLTALLNDASRSSRARVEALKSLSTLQARGWEEAVGKGVTDSAEQVRVAAYGLVAKLDPAVALKLLEGALERGTVRERQAALATLGGARGTEADAVIGRMLDSLIAGKVPAEVQLDVLNAAEKRRTPAIRQALDKYTASVPKDNPLAPFLVTLAGGDAEAGRVVFFDKEAVACLRCHKVDKDGGEVGPELTHIAKEKNREYLLESIIEPNKVIAKGFETVIVNLTDGKRLAGVVKAEDAKVLTIITPEANTVAIPKEQIVDRDTGPSSMPADIKEHLTRAELRDLIEYLASLK